MKRINFLVVSCLISFCLSTVAIGGDMPGPGSPLKPPKHHGHGISAICEPLGTASETAASAACQEATTNLAADATIIAIQAAASVF